MRFAEECVERVTVRHSIRASDLYEHYAQWLRFWETNAKPLGRNKFYEAMDALRFKRVTHGGQNDILVRRQCLGRRARAAPAATDQSNFECVTVDLDRLGRKTQVRRNRAANHRGGGSFQEAAARGWRRQI